MSEAEDKSSHPGTTYDRSDLAAGSIVWFLISLAIALVAIHLISWGLLRYFARYQVNAVPRNAAIMPPSWQANPKGDPALRFPAPQLQPDPVTDLNKFRAEQEEQLNSYGWVDRKNGVAHIPIERAIEIVSQRGLPVRPSPPAGSQ